MPTNKPGYMQKWYAANKLRYNAERAARRKYDPAYRQKCLDQGRASRARSVEPTEVGHVFIEN